MLGRRVNGQVYGISREAASEKGAQKVGAGLSRVACTVVTATASSKHLLPKAQTHPQSQTSDVDQPSCGGKYR